VAFIIEHYRTCKQRGNVLGMTQNFSTRTVAKGLLCVAASVLMALAALVATATARAEPVVEQVKEAAAGEQVSEAAPPVEQVQEAAPPAVPPVEQVSETAPPAEQVEEAVPPVEQVVEKVQETAPPVEQVVEKVEEAVPVESVKEQAKEVPPIVGESIREQAKELAATVEPIKEQLAASSSSPPAPDPQAAVSSAPSTPATEASSALIGALIVSPAGGGPGEPPTASAAASVPVRSVPTRLTSAQRAVELSCELSGLAAAATDNCTAGWLSDRPLLSASPGDLVAVAPARASTPAGSGSGGSGGSFGNTRSFIPPPGPAPSGAVGGSAAGGSGVGLSGFFTLAGQLRLAGPRAMRRLRLSSQPWLTAFFVLIPERPG
jgi:outer membrane biosynthesis protein TonB